MPCLSCDHEQKVSVCIVCIKLFIIPAHSHCSKVKKKKHKVMHDINIVQTPCHMSPATLFDVKIKKLDTTFDKCDH